jgi:hypothetical protein
VAFINANQTKLIYGALPLQAYLRSVTPSASVEMLDVTSLADSAKSYTPGLQDYTLSIEGMFDDSASAGSLWSTITTPIGASSSVVTSAAPSGFALGNPTWLIQANTVSYEPSSNVADVVTFNMSMGSASTSQTGISLGDLTALTATGTGTSVDNSASTSNGFIAQIHVTAASGTTPTMTAIIQHSTNNATWTTLGSFTAITGATSARISGTGTVNRYVRISYTIGGTTPSFTTQISLARL